MGQAKKEFQDIVLSARQDDFFKKNMYSNFGDLGTAVKSLVDEFQRHTANSRNLNTIHEMQNFVENFSEFSAAQRNAGKHVTLVSELSRLVDARTLMQVSGTNHLPWAGSCMHAIGVHEVCYLSIFKTCRLVGTLQ